MTGDQSPKMSRLIEAPDGLGKYVETSKQLAALQQIHAAILHCKNEAFECAITLAASAEGLLPSTTERHLFQLLKNSPVARSDFDYNSVINWLKHPVGPDDNAIPEFEVAIIIVRAISKFIATYRRGSPAMRSFVRWTFEQGHLPLPEGYETL
jgi:hypothetical protein